MYNKPMLKYLSFQKPPSTRKKYLTREETEKRKKIKNMININFLLKRWKQVINYTGTRVQLFVSY